MPLPHRRPPDRMAGEAMLQRFILRPDIPAINQYFLAHAARQFSYSRVSSRASTQ